MIQAPLALASKGKAEAVGLADGEAQAPAAAKLVFSGEELDYITSMKEKLGAEQVEEILAALAGLFSTPDDLDDSDDSESSESSDDSESYESSDDSESYESSDDSESYESSDASESYADSERRNGPTFLEIKSILGQASRAPQRDIFRDPKFLEKKLEDFRKGQISAFTLKLKMLLHKNDLSEFQEEVEESNYSDYRNYFSISDIVWSNTLIDSVFDESNLFFEYLSHLLGEHGAAPVDFKDKYDLRSFISEEVSRVTRGFFERKDMMSADPVGWFHEYVTEATGSLRSLLQDLFSAEHIPNAFQGNFERVQEFIQNFFIHKRKLPDSGQWVPYLREPDRAIQLQYYLEKARRAGVRNLYEMLDLIRSDLNNFNKNIQSIFFTTEGDYETRKAKTREATTYAAQHQYFTDSSGGDWLREAYVSDFGEHYSSQVEESDVGVLKLKSFIYAQYIGVIEMDPWYKEKLLEDYNSVRGAENRAQFQDPYGDLGDDLERDLQRAFEGGNWRDSDSLRRTMDLVFHSYKLFQLDGFKTLVGKQELRDIFQRDFGDITDDVLEAVCEALVGREVFVADIIGLLSIAGLRVEFVQLLREEGVSINDITRFLQNPGEMLGSAPPQNALKKVIKGAVRIYLRETYG